MTPTSLFLVSPLKLGSFKQRGSSPPPAPCQQARVEAKRPSSGLAAHRAGMQRTRGGGGEGQHVDLSAADRRRWGRPHLSFAWRCTGCGNFVSLWQDSRGREHLLVPLPQDPFCPQNIYTLGFMGTPNYCSSALAKCTVVFWLVPESTCFLSSGLHVSGPPTPLQGRSQETACS